MKVALYRTGRPFTEKFMENFQSGFMPGEAKFYTYDEYNTWNASGYKSWIDFIFYNNSSTHQPFKQYILRPTMSYKGSKMDLADHYQIVLETVIY